MMRRLILPAIASLVAVLWASGCTIPSVTATPSSDPSVSVTPNTDLVGGQQVTVRGSGYSPSSSLGIIQCVAPADGFDDCTSETAHSFSADSSGGYQLQYDVTRILEFGNGVEHDCAIPDSCFLVSVYIHGFQGRAATPLHFAPGEAVSAWPDTNLTDGQGIQVNGYGYAPNAPVGLVQCPARAESIDQCDGRTADSFSADAEGNFTRPMTVLKVIRDAHGVETDCAVPDSCVVASMYPHGFQGLATDVLHFAP
jgi:hypothetical protein